MQILTFASNEISRNSAGEWFAVKQEYAPFLHRASDPNPPKPSDYYREVLRVSVPAEHEDEMIELMNANGRADIIIEFDDSVTPSIATRVTLVVSE